jgi:hypothetical protein
MVCVLVCVQGRVHPLTQRKPFSGLERVQVVKPFVRCQRTPTTTRLGNTNCYESGRGVHPAGAITRFPSFEHLFQFQWPVAAVVQRKAKASLGPVPGNAYGTGQDGAEIAPYGRLANLRE